MIRCFYHKAETFFYSSIRRGESSWRYLRLLCCHSYCTCLGLGFAQYYTTGSVHINVTLRCVRATTGAGKKQQALHNPSVCVCVCVFVASDTQHATRMCCIILPPACGLSGSTIFFHIISRTVQFSISRNQFRLTHQLLSNYLIYRLHVSARLGHIRPLS
jgi:hypothetical protein